MRSRHRSGQARSWRIGLSLMAGAGILLGLARARGWVSRRRAVAAVRADEDRDPAVAGDPPAQVAPRQGLAGPARLALWAAGRLLLIAAAGWLVWVIGVGQAASDRALSGSASATVTSTTGSRFIYPGIFEPGSDQVRFRTTTGHVVRTTIDPYNATLVREQEVPVHYDPASPARAEYAGPGGDDNYADVVFDYAAAAVVALVAAALLACGAARLTGIIRAAVATPVRPELIQAPGEYRMRAEHPQGGYSLEWRVLWFQPDTTGELRLHGTLAAGQWLVIRRADDRLIWPASKAQPVLDSAAPELPVVRPGPAGSARLLLAGYAQVIGLLATLPTVIHRPPEPGANWWRIGALRPVVETLVTVHLRRRLAVLGSALLRAALVCDDDPASPSRRELAEASSECLALAGTLPRRGWLAVLVTAIATALSIVGPFLPLPHIPFSPHAISQHVVQLLFSVLVFGIAPLLVYFRSVQCKRALLSPASASTSQPADEQAALPGAGWDVYKLEHDAFTAVAVPEPAEWESGEVIPLLVSVIYYTAIVYYFTGHHFIPTIIVLGATVALVLIIAAATWLHGVLTRQGPQEPTFPALCSSDTYHRTRRVGSVLAQRGTGDDRSRPPACDAPLRRRRPHPSDTTGRRASPGPGLHEPGLAIPLPAVLHHHA
jgi:hypothetical protein